MNVTTMGTDVVIAGAVAGYEARKGLGDSPVDALAEVVRMLRASEAEMLAWVRAVLADDRAPLASVA